jgi:hypothetical protein
MKTMSLRARIIAAMVFVGVALIAAGFIVTTTTHGYLVHQVDARLDGADRSGRGQNVRDLGVRGPRDDPDGQGRPGRRDSIERLGDVYEGVITADGVLQPVFVPNLGVSSLFLSSMLLRCNELRRLTESSHSLRRPVTE